MSFTFGEFHSDSLDLIATLRQLPSLAGLQLETLGSPGTDGLILGGTTRSFARLTFDVIIKGATATEAYHKRDALVLAIDPARGEQNLTFDAAPGWRWRAIASSPIGWNRLTWDAGAGYQLRDDVSFDALEAYGRLVDDETWSWASTGNRTVEREHGNARSFPTVEVEGTLTVEQTVTLTIGGIQLVVSGPLASGEVLRLDWESFDFGRWAGTTKVASVVRAMSTLDRVELWPGVPTPFNTATTGTVTRVALNAKSRRQ